MEATQTRDEEVRAPVELPAKGRPQPAAAPPARSSRRPFLILGVVAAVVLAGLATYSVMTAGQETTDDAQVEADVVPLASRVSGQVLHVRVQDNQQVKKGDLLVEIDDADYAAKVKQSEAELETTRAQAAAADAQVRVVEATAKGGLSSARAALSGSSVAVSSADAQIAAAKATLQRAQADAHKAELDLARTKELRAANAVPQERLDNALVAQDSAQAALAQAEAQVSASSEAKKAAESRVQEAQGRYTQSAPIDAQIAAVRANGDLAHARVKSAEAMLELARLQLSYTKVLAPAAGFVSKLGVHEGQLVSPGLPMAELVPAETYLVANFKETQVGGMKKGQKAEIKIDAFGGRKFEGKVESISGGTGARFSLLPPDNASGNFVKVVQRVPVRIAWERPADVAARAGLSADVTVEVK